MYEQVKYRNLHPNEACSGNLSPLQNCLQNLNVRKVTLILTALDSRMQIAF